MKRWIHAASKLGDYVIGRQSVTMRPIDHASSYVRKYCAKNQINIDDLKELNFSYSILYNNDVNVNSQNMTLNDAVRSVCQMIVDDLEYHNDDPTIIGSHSRIMIYGPEKHEELFYESSSIDSNGEKHNLYTDRSGNYGMSALVGYPTTVRLWLDDVLSNNSQFKENMKLIDRGLSPKSDYRSDKLTENMPKHKVKKYTDAFFNKRQDANDVYLKWAESALEDYDEDLTEEEAIEVAKDIAEQNGWHAWETVGEQCNDLYEINEGDVEQVIRSFDIAYGNGDRMYPLEYGDEEVFYNWVKKYHPEADTSAVDKYFQ